MNKVQSAGTESRLQEATTHTIEFDPHSQHITLHTLAVRLGTQVIEHEHKDSARSG